MNRLLLPSELLMMSLKNSSIRTTQIWLWLKFNSSGDLKYTSSLVKRISVSLRVSTKTIKRHIEKLKAKNWIGYNRFTKMLYIRSINSVCNIEDVTRQKAYWLFKRDLPDLKKFAFACGVSDIIKYKQAQEWERSNKRGRQIKFPSFALSISYISNRFNLSKSFVKTLMKSNKFINVYSNNTPYLVGGKTCKAKDFHTIKKHGNFNKLRIVKGVIVVNESNSISSNLHHKRRRF